MNHNNHLNGFTIYDPGFARGTPDDSTPARRAAIFLENRIRHNLFETGGYIKDDGTLIAQKKGTPNQVQFSPAELALADGTLFTHNHPNDMSFSTPDVINAVQQRLIELRAVGPTIRYIMRPTQFWPSCISIDSAIRAVLSHIHFDVHGRVRSGQLQFRFATLEIQHLVWERISHKLSLEYIREAT